MTKNPNWKNDKHWENGKVNSNNGLALIISLVFFIIFSLISLLLYVNFSLEIQPAIEKILRGELTQFERGFIPLIAFLVTMLTVRPLLKTYRDWKYYKDCVLTLNPFPGYIGGQVGGSIHLPFDYHSDLNAVVKVNCIKVTISRSSDSSNRNDSVKWRKIAKSKIEHATQGGINLKFVCDIPDELPETSVDESHGSFYWSVRIDVNDGVFDQDFRIPVINDVQKRASSIYINDHYVEKTKQSGHNYFTRIQQTPNELQLHYSSGRTGQLAKILLGVGLVFAGVGVFMGSVAYGSLTGDKVDVFSLLVEVMIGIPFFLIGMAMFVWGMYSITNSMDIKFDSHTVQINKKSLYGSSQELLKRSNIKGFAKTITAQAGSGAMSTIYFKIHAVLQDNTHVNLGDDIRGLEEADYILAVYNQQLGLADDHQDMSKEPIGTQPEWVKNLVGYLKIGSTVMTVIVMLVFAYSFIGG